MSRNRISVSTSALHSDVKQALHLAMTIGARGVEFDIRHELRPHDYGETARRQLNHFLRERDLVVAAAHFPLRGPLATEDRLDERLAALSTAIEFASQLRIGILTLRAGRIPQAEGDTRDRWMAVLSDLAAQGNRHGVVICLLPAGDPAEELRAVLENVRTGPLAVVADPAGWLLQGQSPVEQMRVLYEHVKHVEMRDAVRDVDGPGKEVPFGRGEVDWDDFAATLEEMNYRGWLNVNRTDGNDRPGDVSRAVQYLRNLIPGLGEDV